MTTRLGLAACVATFFTVAGLAAPLLGGPADDTPAKEGVEAKVAFAKLKTLVGSWKSKISDDKDGAAKEHEAAKTKEHEEAKTKEHEEDHPERLAGYIQADRCRQCSGRDAVSGHAATRWFRFTTSMARSCG